MNPVAAVLIGHVLGGEALGLRTMTGTACVLVSLVPITPGKKQAPVAAAKGAS